MLFATSGEIDSFDLIIGAALIVLLSYTFDFIAKKFSIPSVILLIVLGMGITWALDRFLDVENVTGTVIPVLQVLGTVGLILIVLEAALDLRLEKKKTKMIWMAFFVALFVLLLTVFGVAFVLVYFLEIDLLLALVYATPLSIMSSAIVIPSVGNLAELKKEFMIYEATFSDILGIILFFFLTGLDLASESMTGALFSELFRIIITIIISVIVSYGLVYFISRITKKANFFTIFALLALFYALGKKLHLSSLITILVFGLILYNTKIFFKGKLENLISKDYHERIIEDFKLLTHQSAFLVRTFFFVAFGMIISFSSGTKEGVLLIAGSALIIMYLIRFAHLKFVKAHEIMPELFIAPRGLITVLLFFQIPEKYKDMLTPDQLELMDGTMFDIILVTALVMMLALIFAKKDYDVIEDITIVDESALLGYGRDIKDLS